MTPIPNQTLAGKDGTVGYESKWLGSGTIGHGVAGALTGFLASDDGFDGETLIAMDPDSELNGLTLDANGQSSFGLLIDTTIGDTVGTRYVANSTITNTTTSGVRARGSGVGVRIDKSRITGSLSEGVQVRDGATANISNSYIYNNIRHGIQSHHVGSTVDISNSDIHHNGHGGVVASASSSIKISNSDIHHNGQGGVIGDRFGVIEISNSTISSNTVYGVGAFEGATVTVSHSTISNNGSLGVYTNTWNGGVNGDTSTVEAVSTIILNDVTITGSVGNEYLFAGTSGYGILNQGSNVIVTNSRVFDNATGSYFNQIGTVPSNASHCLRNDGTIEVDGVQIPQTRVNYNDKCALPPDQRIP